MEITEKEKESIYRCTEILERKTRYGRLESQDINNGDLWVLLRSYNKDISLFGLYTLDFLPTYRIFEISQHENSNLWESLIRYILSENLSMNDNLPRELREKLEKRRKLRNILNLMERTREDQLNKESTSPNTTILVHGTWVKSSEWWKPGGSFWNYVQRIKGNLYSGKSPFSWSGSNKHRERQKAAEELVKWTKKHVSGKLDVIAHSHGGNVCFIASHLGLKIRKLVTLGTPMRLEYLPNYNNIKSIHNVYSTTDFTQKVATLPNRRSEGRSLGDSQKITNYWAYDNGTGRSPGHTELHTKKTFIKSSLQDPLLKY